MSTELDTITEEDNGIEDRVNENFGAVGPAAAFALHQSESAALHLALYEGISPLTGAQVAAYETDLTAATTNYVWLTRADVVTRSTSIPAGWASGSLADGAWPIGVAVAGASTFTWTDVRRFGAPPILGIPYAYSSTTASADPGSGTLRFNNAALASATALYISETDGLGRAIAAVIALWDDGAATNKSQLTVSKTSDPTKFAVFNVTGTNTDNGAWDTVVLTYVTGAGALANGDAVTLVVARNGDVGASGSVTGTGFVFATAGAFDAAAKTVTASATLLGVDKGICNFRLTLETGVAVSTTDQTAKTTIYCTPYAGNQIGLYNGTTWDVISSAEVSLALGTLTSGKNYDVFGYNNAGTFTLEFSAAWTNDTTRADALALQDGVYCKSGTLTRRYLGTFRTTATTTTEDSVAKRFVWNRYNQRPRGMRNATETTDSWTYSTSSFRQANANAANQLDYVTGDAETLIEAHVYAVNINSTGAGASFTAGIGVNSTSASSAIVHGQNGSTSLALVQHAIYMGHPGLGRNYIAWLEYGAAVTTTWYGDAGGPTIFQSGIVGTILN